MTRIAVRVLRDDTASPMRNNWKRPAAAWLTQDALWLVSKTVTDKLRAYLLSQSIEGIPSSHIAVLDELQSNGLVESTPEGKAIWTALVAQWDRQQSFTFFCAYSRR